MNARGFAWYLAFSLAGWAPSLAEAQEVRLFGRWNGANNPGNLGVELNLRFSELPQVGTLAPEHTPWSDSYWPNYRGGVSYRAQTEETGFRTRLLSKEEALRATASELAILSPAEKFDIWRGRFDYPTVRSERGRTSPRHPSWTGLCHGWAVASIHHAEPKPKTLASLDGIQVPFGSSDIKAILTYYYGVDQFKQAPQVGTRCFVPRFLGSMFSKCNGANAGAFHSILANRIGRMQRSFTLDISRGKEVWNHPVISYESAITQTGSPVSGSAYGTVRRVLVETTMLIADEIEPTSEAVLGTAKQKIKPQEYEYWLELGASDEILGGEWVSATRPDFLWLRPAETLTQGYYAAVKELL